MGDVTPNTSKVNREDAIRFVIRRSLVRDSAPMHTGQIFRDLSGAFDELLSPRNLDMGVLDTCFFQNQNWTALVFLSEKTHQFGPRADKVHISNLHMLFQSGIKLQQPYDLRAAGTEKRALSVILKIWSDEKEKIAAHDDLI